MSDPVDIVLRGSRDSRVDFMLNAAPSLFPSVAGVKKLLFICGLALLTQAIKPQVFTEIDASTYQLYLERNWDELIREGKSALKQGIDYYYLRMRIGIAFYEKKNYKAAQSHFRKALELGNDDPAASEYLYYSYLFGGQTQQASLLYKVLPAKLKEKIPSTGQKMVDRVSAEYLYNQTFTDGLVGDPGTFDGLPPGIQIITRSFQNLNLSLQHIMHPGTSFTHAYTYLGKSSFYHYDDGIYPFGVEGQRVNQHQYYLSPSFTFRRGLVISPAFHFLYVGYQVPSLSGGGTGPGGNDIVFTNESENQMAGGLALEKHQGTLSLRLGAMYSNLNHAGQLTGSAGLAWYPLGNLDLYAGASLNVHMDDVDEGKTTLIPGLLVGWGIASKVWIELTGTYGKMKNYTESNAYIVYNSLEWMKYKVLANLILPVTKKGSTVYAGARFAGYENQFIPLDPARPRDLNDLNYNSLSIFGGLSWKF